AVGVAVDGCSAPTFVLPARSAASAFAALAVSDEAGPRRLRAAVSASPVLYAGNGRTCTKLLAAFDGGVYPKSGAEGFYALGVRDARLGLALKIDDGAQRATEALVATLLLRLLPDLPSKTRSALEAMRRTPVRNAAGLTVGAIEATPP
ncbi:MAG TPA: asparaginase, partial [Planctomycetota bacterium]|nr:asparaginase [Planctomycetota bacterium]